MTTTTLNVGFLFSTIEKDGTKRHILSTSMTEEDGGDCLNHGWKIMDGARSWMEDLYLSDGEGQ
jgi:hypothetical protein